MSEYFGNPSVFVSQDWEWSPGPLGGDTIIQRHTGSPGAMISLMNAYRNAGYQCRHSIADGRSEVTAVLPLFQVGSTAETPSDAYDINTDFVQQKIWGGQYVIEAALAHIGATLPTAEDVIAFWRAEIEAALIGADNGGPLPPEDTGFAGALYSLYVLVLMGGDTYEVAWPVLTRVRTISIQYSAAMVIDGAPKVYSTSALASTFGIPPGIIARIPGGSAASPYPPTKPFATEFAWKLRRDERHIEMNGKVQEVKDWVFAAWSTITHDYIA